MHSLIRNLSDAIFDHARNRPEQPAIIDGPRTLSWYAFAQRVAQATVYLRDLGVQVHEPLALVLDNHVEHFILSFAAFRIGAIPFSVPTELPQPVRDELIFKHQIHKVFVEPTDRGAAQAAVRIVVGVDWCRTLDALAGDVRSPLPGTELHTVLLTSGSSGIPKGTLTTQHQRLLRGRCHADMLGTQWGPDNPGTALLKVSISNTGFHQFFLNQIQFGGTVRLLPAIEHLGDLARAMAPIEDGVCFATANMCRALLACCESHHGPDRPLLPGLRALVSMGVPLAAHEKQRLMQCVTPHFFDYYGTSGSGMISGLKPADIAAHAGTIGQATFDIALQVVDQQGRSVPAGTPGEVRCQGPAVALGFRLPQDGTLGAETFAGGWYYPGDIASLDEQGWLTLHGRKSDLIRHSGKDLYPWHVESVLARLPGIKEAAVVGMPAASGDGEVPVAVVVSETPIHQEVLAAYCAVSLAPEQRPLGFVAAPGIPKTPSGKVDRVGLRRQVEALLEQAAAAQAA